MSPLNQTPLLSIVITAYNHVAYLQECIESILVQGYPRVELILLNDGSTDKTPDILLTYGDRFYWENQANMGQSPSLITL
jgi:glycosyltransferase involved in cell wall biosynthesis